MRLNSYKKEIRKLLLSADIKINGNRPWDIQILDDRVYERVLKDGTLGFGEAYMDGEWDCQSIDQLVFRLTKAKLDQKVSKNIKLISYVLLSKLINYSRKANAFEIGERHYDTGNDLFKLMLDKRMVYTCGYWKNAKTLDQAQEDKLDLVCLKIGLKKGMKILDIGGGWGSFAKYAAEKYQVKVVNVTVSREQVKLANELCQGLPVENRLMDYRDLDEKFDRIVSLGMFEHVGFKNYRTYMEVANRCLKENGLFLLHTIGLNSTAIYTEPWTQKYIFPNSTLPSIKQIGEAIEGLFVMEDWHNFGSYYDKTLMTWFENFDKNWPKIKDKYSERFYRMWKFWLLSSAASFRARNLQLWQIVLSKNGVDGGYQSIR